MDLRFTGIAWFTETELHKYFGNQINNIAIAHGEEEKVMPT